MKVRSRFVMCARHGHRLGGESPLVSWSQRAKRNAERRTARTAWRKRGAKLRADEHKWVW